MKTMNLIHELFFEVSPEAFYRAIMSVEEHSTFTNSTVNILDETDSEFDAYNNYILGKNVLLEPGKLIVQEWRAVEDNWPDYHYSTVQFKLKPLDGGTHLTFVHKGIPEEYFESISTGWDEYYWQPLKKYFKAMKDS